MGAITIIPQRSQSPSSPWAIAWAASGTWNAVLHWVRLLNACTFSQDETSMSPLTFHTPQGYDQCLLICAPHPRLSTIPGIVLGTIHINDYRYI